ncbi:MAG: CapA family protein, partial [Thermoproteota archaeon]
GRGIDQVLPHSGDPTLYEPFVRDARGYVELAESVNGPIPKPVDFSYIWGDALAELERVEPDLMLINLETAVTTSDERWNKGIHYRMHPGNIPCLTVARIDVCSLSNNHVLDWGYSGLIETLEALSGVKVEGVGAGRTLEEAEAPVWREVNGQGRVVVFSYGLKTSGIPSDWAATDERPGVNLLEDLSESTVGSIKKKIEGVTEPEDLVVVSLHWGGNWGYAIPPRQIRLAHQLVEDAGVDVIHGHSSHHVKGIEVYRGGLILYGCGDFLTDYEGIKGHEAFRPDLSLMYFANLEPSTGELTHLRMVPTQVKRFRVNRGSRDDAVWLRDMLNRESSRFGTQARLNEDGTLTLEW